MHSVLWGIYGKNWVCRACGKGIKTQIGSLSRFIKAYKPFLLGCVNRAKNMQFLCGKLLRSFSFKSDLLQNFIQTIYSNLIFFIFRKNWKFKCIFKFFKRFCLESWVKLWWKCPEKLSLNCTSRSTVNFLEFLKFNWKTHKISMQITVFECLVKRKKSNLGIWN